MNKPFNVLYGFVMNVYDQSKEKVKTIKRFQLSIQLKR